MWPFDDDSVAANTKDSIGKWGENSNVTKVSKPRCETYMDNWQLYALKGVTQPLCSLF